MDNTEQIILLARQRSGTNALKSVLATHPDIFCSPEIFNTTAGSRKNTYNFFSFLQDTQAKAEALFPWNVEKSFELFLDHMHGVSQKKRYQILDIKYNSTHILNREWQSLDYVPFLFSYIQEKPMRVIHLRRENTLRQWVSRANAEALQTWMVLQGESRETAPPLIIDIKQLWEELRSMKKENAIVAQALKHCDVLEVQYSLLFTDSGGYVPDSQLQRIADWLGTDCHFDHEPKFVKQTTRPLHEMIENYAEVAKKLKGTSFEWMLTQDRID